MLIRKIIVYFECHKTHKYINNFYGVFPEDGGSVPFRNVSKTTEFDISEGGNAHM
jgi:hypothetical protein